MVRYDATAPITNVACVANRLRIVTAAVPTGPMLTLLFATATAVPCVKDRVESSSTPVPRAKALFALAHGPAREPSIGTMLLFVTHNTPAAMVNFDRRIATEIRYFHPPHASGSRV